MTDLEPMAKLSLRVHPNAASNEVTGFIDGVWHVRVAVPPVKGQANRELIAFLGQALNIAKSRISITRGYSARSKVIAVDGLSQEDIRERLAPA
ncbi:DUF167 domain-containing protein [Chloroflexota bacterium]